MSKSLAQPTIESEESYFQLYFDTQYAKIHAEVIRMNKRLDKVNRARQLYQQKFGKTPKLTENFEEV